MNPMNESDESAPFVFSRDVVESKFVAFVVFMAFLFLRAFFVLRIVISDVRECFMNARLNIERTLHYLLLLQIQERQAPSSHTLAFRLRTPHDKNTSINEPIRDFLLHALQKRCPTHCSECKDTLGFILQTINQTP
jgi:hypothetical protein